MLRLLTAAACVVRTEARVGTFANLFLRRKLAHFLVLCVVRCSRYRLSAKEHGVPAKDSQQHQQRLPSAEHPQVQRQRLAFTQLASVGSSPQAVKVHHPRCPLSHERAALSYLPRPTKPARRSLGSPKTSFRQNPHRVASTSWWLRNDDLRLSLCVDVKAGDDLSVRSDGKFLESSGQGMVAERC